LPDKSKKVSKFSDAALEVGQAIYQLGHATAPDGVQEKSNDSKR
jgi:hypothetical protein